MVYGPLYPASAGKFSVESGASITGIRRSMTCAAIPISISGATPSASINVANGYAASYNPTGGTPPIPMYEFLREQQRQLERTSTFSDGFPTDARRRGSPLTVESMSVATVAKFPPPRLPISSGVPAPNPDEIWGNDSTGKTDDVTKLQTDALLPSPGTPGEGLG